jgi:hypothetical protein
MDDVIDRRLGAEHARDIEAILATCTHDIEQDVAGADFALDEAVIEAIAHGRPFEMRDGLIGRESIWADIAAIRRQLSPPVAS